MWLLQSTMTFICPEQFFFPPGIFHKLLAVPGGGSRSSRLYIHSYHSRHALISPCILGKSVMLYAAETIPKLKTRTQKMGGSDQSLQQGEGGKKGKGKKKK